MILCCLINNIKSLLTSKSQDLFLTFLEVNKEKFNAEKKFISYQDNEIILTAKEWAILERIIESPKSTVTKAALENSLYAFDDDISSNTIEVYISQIRKKTCKEIIVTVRGIGYRLGQND